jgi:hypothetical protein
MRSTFWGKDGRLIPLAPALPTCGSLVDDTLAIFYGPRCIGRFGPDGVARATHHAPALRQGHRAGPALPTGRVNRFNDGRFAPAACRRSKAGTKRTRRITRTGER